MWYSVEQRTSKILNRRPRQSPDEASNGDDQSAYGKILIVHKSSFMPS